MESAAFMCFLVGTAQSASFLGVVTFMKIPLVLTLFPGPSENFSRVIVMQIHANIFVEMHNFS
jgi:hypothetical protein